MNVAPPARNKAESAAGDSLCSSKFHIPPKTFYLLAARALIMIASRDPAHQICEGQPADQFSLHFRLSRQNSPLAPRISLLLKIAPLCSMSLSQFVKIALSNG